MTLKSIIPFLLAAAIFCSCNSGISSSSSAFTQDRPKTPEELRMELKNQELDNPLQYLTDSEVTIKTNSILVKKETMFRNAKYKDDGAIIEGYIRNNATLAKYKDVVVNVSYYSATNTLIEEKQFVFYEFYEPNSNNHFSLKVYPPSAYKTFGFQVVGAKSAN